MKWLKRFSDVEFLRWTVILLLLVGMYFLFANLPGELATALTGLAGLALIIFGVFYLLKFAEAVLTVGAIVAVIDNLVKGVPPYYGFVAAGVMLVLAWGVHMWRKS